MELDQIVQLQNEVLQRVQHAEKTGGYLGFQKEALNLLMDLVASNGDGRYTYAMHGLLTFIDRLRGDAWYHIRGAQGIEEDDIPF